MVEAKDIGIDFWFGLILYLEDDLEKFDRSYNYGL